MSAEEAEEAMTVASDGSVAVRILAALLVKGEAKPAAAIRLLNLGLSANDVARVLEIKPSSVRTIKSRAKTRAAEPEDDTPEPTSTGA